MSDVDELIDWLDRWWLAADQPTIRHDGVEYLAAIALARSLLASDWLAAREAAAEARGAERALREAADAWDWPFGYGDSIRQWLRARAAAAGGAR